MCIRPWLLCRQNLRVVCIGHHHLEQSRNTFWEVLEKTNNSNWYRTHIYGPGKPLSALNSRALSSIKTGPLAYRKKHSHLAWWCSASRECFKRAYCYSCFSTLVSRNFFKRTLYFRDVYILIWKLHCITQDRSSFDKLVLVSSDEMDLGEGHDDLEKAHAMYMMYVVAWRYGTLAASTPPGTRTRAWTWSPTTGARA